MSERCFKSHRKLARGTSPLLWRPRRTSQRYVQPRCTAGPRSTSLQSSCSQACAPTRSRAALPPRARRASRDTFRSLLRPCLHTTHARALLLQAHSDGLLPPSLLVPATEYLEAPVAVAYSFLWHLDLSLTAAALTST
eukprot:3730213-Pleurochrysis_carterae.AAC.2